MLKQLLPALRATLVLAALLGLAFPLAITGVAQVLFPGQANGSLIRGAGGKVIGSRLIGQSFAKPEYFHPRPSAAGSGYDGTASSGTNLGPTSEKLLNGIHKKTDDGKDDPGNYDGVADLVAAYRTENGLSANAAVPVDAVTRSASGLDPHISPANALLQAARVAKARKLPPAEVEALVRQQTEGRDLGLLGEPRVNVLELNLALDRAASAR
jgi:K+-transporting ATPase ATPase C chain